MQLVDLADDFRASSFKVFRGAIDAGGVVKAINAKGFAGITIGQSRRTDRDREKLRRERTRLDQGRKRRMEIADREILQRRGKGGAADRSSQLEEGDLIFFAADKWEIACEVLGRLRLRVAEMQKPNEGLRGSSTFFWVTEFPLLAFEPEENKWNAVASSVHPPESRRRRRCSKRRRYAKVRAEAYDVVLNGVEIGGGSIRIHEPDLQAKMFAVLGVNDGGAAVACSAICCARSASARRRTAASRSGSIGS